MNKPELVAADMRAVARRLAPKAAAAAEAAQAARRMPLALAQEMAAAGVFRMVLPRALGGPEEEPQTVCDVIETFAQADASAGWCVMIASTTTLCAAYMEPAAAAAIFAAPGAISAGVFAPDGRARIENGGYRVSGRWRWGSGSTHATWIAGGCFIETDDGLRSGPDGAPENRMIFFPAGEVELIDTWRVVGLEGTGSGDIAVTDRLAPRERSVALASDRPWADGPLYAFPAFGLLAMGVAAVALGNARAALDALIALGGGKTPKGSRRVLAEKGYAQADLAKAEAALRGARAFLREAVETCWEEAREVGAISPHSRALLRLAATNAARTGADAARTAHDLGGGTSVFLDCPLQKRLRDAHVATQHMMVGHPTYELAGRTLFGLPGIDPTF